MQREKVRVYALARELDIESKDLLEICKQAGFDVKNQLSSLEPDQRDQVVEMIKKGVTKEPAPTAPVKKVTPTVLPGERHVPNLTSKPSRAKEPEAAPVAEAEPDVAETPAQADEPEIVEQAPATESPSEEVPAEDSSPTAPSQPESPGKQEATPDEPESPQKRTERPQEKPRPPVSSPPSRVPVLPSASVPNLSSRSTPRIPRKHASPTLKPMPVTPPPLKALPPRKKLEEPTQKPIQKIDPKLFNQDRPLRPEDIMPPTTPQVEVIDDEDDKGKKPKRIPGRNDRRAARAERAAKRKVPTGPLKRGDLEAAVDDEPRTRGHKRFKKPKTPTQPRIGKIPVEMPITVRSLSEALGVRSVELIFKLKEHENRLLNINSALDPELAELMAVEYGCEIEIKKPLNAEEELLLHLDKPDDPSDLIPRAPIVTVMGHVDHGKTTLLDKIRQSDVVSSEVGGITQVIRAWRVDHNGRPITFLDTPGHEAFTKMRARGAVVTDIAVIVVAADDGVMPQTEEAINHAKAAGVSLVIAINKIDLPGANVNRARQQLYGLEVLPDNMGGDTPFVECSGATGDGIDELLDQLSVVAELKELKANPNKPARGTCLEAMLSEGEGVRATLLVREGTLNKGDIILCGHAFGRVRQLYNDHGEPIDSAGPSVPVRITGLNVVPNADDTFVVLPDLATARDIADKRTTRMQDAAQIKRPALTLETVADLKIDELKVILKADFRGSVEAIRKELEKLEHEEVRVRVLHAGIGAITESDVQLALTSPEDTMILGFNVVPDDRALALAEEKGIQIREYDIIYNLTNDIRAALEGKLKPREEIVHLGRAVVRQTFKISRVGTIAGCYVTQGNIKRNAKVRVIREGVVVYPPAERTASLETLKRFKEDASEVREGFECGIKVAGYDDIKVGDVVEAYRVEQVQRTLAD